MPARTGTAQLPLHGGRAPAWLFSRMVQLAREITIHIASEYGSEEMLRRLSDPFWFQAFGCVLGFDWHSSGVTTTVTGAVKEGVKGLEHDLRFYAGGGKGAVSRKTPAEITMACERMSIDPRPLVYASRMAAKVDSAAVQDGYQLYHHSFFFTPAGSWCVVQQGMNDGDGMARRYHWLAETVKSYVNEPHAAVCDDRVRQGAVPAGTPTLNLVAAESDPLRSASAALARGRPEVVLGALKTLPALTMPRRHAVLIADVNPQYLERILLKTYERAPEDFETLLGMQGVGARTLRALALTSEIIYGTRASTRDPARFSFAHGGKDGFPYPVDVGTYDRTVEALRAALTKAGITRSERVAALKRLARFGEERIRRRRAAEAKAVDGDGCGAGGAAKRDGD